MQLYAFDENKKLVFVKQATKKKNYFCRECNSALRIRSGERTKPHFFHLAQNTHCSQSGKSLLHIHLQLYLQTLIPNAQLEKPFPEIKRIADVVVEDKKLIFEIQCSFITKEELEARNRDYASLGYTVIWILHEQTFNKNHLKAAERALLSRPFFYTNIDLEGRGTIFDRSIRAIPSLSIELDQVKPFPQDNVPSFFNARKKVWPFHFKGDLIDRHQEYLDLLKDVKKPPLHYLKKIKLFIKESFHTFLNNALESSCR